MKTGMKRREFIRRSVFGSVGLSGITAFGITGKTRMGYRKLGRTGLLISEISLGGSPVPPEPVLRLALDLGVNYIDTSSTYQNGNSERLIGKLIRGRRDKIHVTTKFHPGRLWHTTNDLIKEVEGSLKRLETDYIDALLVHGASDPDILAEEYVLKAFDQLKKQGKIRFTGVSCHKNPVEVLIPAIQSNNYDIITVAYNAYSGTLIQDKEVYADYLNRSGIEKVLDAARQKNVGVVAMKTLAGGDRQVLDRYKSKGTSIIQAKLKWVLQNKAVSAIITEMVNFEYLEENLAAGKGRMTSKEKRFLAHYLQNTSKRVCRMCGACQKHCSQGIKIPEILRYGLYYTAYHKTSLAKEKYSLLPNNRLADKCSRCRTCEKACPYGVPVTEQLAEYHQLLS